MNKSRADLAESCFKQGFVCSQAVFSTYSERLGLDRQTALKIGDAFGAGMGGQAETCGAVTGAMLVIGLKYGRTQPGDQAAKEKTRGLVKELFREFSARRGSTTCRDLLGYDIGTPEGMETAEKEGLFDTLCPALIRDAVEILERIM